jgi:hypothetical protein
VGRRATLDRFECGGAARRAVDFDEAPLIDRSRLHETVALPLPAEFSRLASRRACCCDLEQQRPYP